MSEYTQGVWAILKDGQPMTVEEILSGLRQRDEALEREQALAAHQESLIRELTSCQSVLFQLARDREVTPQYADDAKRVLAEAPATSLARLVAGKRADELLWALDLLTRPYAGEDGCRNPNAVSALQERLRALRSQAGYRS